MLKDLGREMFLEEDEISPLAEKDMECIGNISDFLGDEYPCDDIYRYWVFRNPSEREKKFYAFWDLGNGWWSGKYFVADNLVSLWKELKVNAGADTEAVNRTRQMTNEEAISIIENRDSIMDYCESQQLAEALDVAVEALGAQPCEDAVSREAVLEITAETGALETQARVKALPPVTPQPKIGHWIVTGDYLTTAYGSVDYVKCSCCKEDSLEEGDFCPNCGAKMIQ